MNAADYVRAFAIGFAGVIGGRVGWATFDVLVERMGRLFR